MQSFLGTATLPFLLLASRVPFFNLLDSREALYREDSTQVGPSLDFCTLFIVYAAHFAILARWNVVQYEKEASGPCEVVGCFLSKWSNKNAIARSAPRERGFIELFLFFLARARSSSCFFHFLSPSFCRNKRGKKICHREIETKAPVLRYEQRRIPPFCCFCSALTGAAPLR